MVSTGFLVVDKARTLDCGAGLYRVFFLGNAAYPVRRRPGSDRRESDAAGKLVSRAGALRPGRFW